MIFIRKKSELGFEGKNTIESTDILKSLVSITDVNSDIDKDLRKTSLKILRKIIEMENKALTTPAAEWDTDDWIKFEYQITERQNMLIELGVVKLICRVIAYENLRSIREEALLTAIAVLLGGNYRSQMKFYRYVLKDTENTFALKLKEMILEYFDIIQTTNQRRNQQMLKYSQLQNSNHHMSLIVHVEIEELREMFDSDSAEIKKMEQQL